MVRDIIYLKGILMDLPSGYADIMHLSTQVQTCHSSTRGKSQLSQSLTSSRTVQMDINSAGQVVYMHPLPSLPSSMNLQPLNLKSEDDRRKTFKYWYVPFMDVNQLAAAGFFFTNRGDVVIHPSAIFVNITSPEAVYIT